MIKYLLILLIIGALIVGLYSTLEKRRSYPALPNLNSQTTSTQNIQNIEEDLTAMDRDLLELEQLDASLYSETQDL